MTSRKRTVLEQARHATLLRTLSPTILRSDCSLVQEDAVALLAGMGTGSAGLMTTDPAYEALEKHRATGTTTRLKHSKASSNDWFPIFPNARYGDLFAEAYRVLQDDAHLYMCCASDHDQADVMIQAGRRAGFRFWKGIVWDKVRLGMGYHWRCRHELVLFFEKGKRRLRNLGWADVIPEPPVDGVSDLVERLAERYDHLARGVEGIVAGADGHPLLVMDGPVNREHLRDAIDGMMKELSTTIVVESIRGKKRYPTEKPVGLWRRLIENSSDPGDLVVDPFLGSGSSAEAALTLGRRFVGGDIEWESIRWTDARLDTLIRDATNEHHHP